MRVECELYQLMISDTLMAQRVVLKEKDGQRMFPIFIGPVEISAIDRNLNGRIPPRPLTHDLAYSVIEALGGRLVSICIKDLRESIFYADLEIMTDKGLVKVDCRPSDAMARAVKAGAKIYAEEHVLDEAAIS